MSNITSDQMRKDIWSFYKSRLVGSLGVVLLISSGVAFATLVPAYLALAAVPVLSISDAAKAGPNQTQNLTRASNLVAGIETASTSTVPMFDALRSALAGRPAGVTESASHYAHGDTSKLVTSNLSTIELEGQASSRDRIDSYIATLNADSHFKTVAVPVSVLAGSDDGHFSITLTGAF